MPANIIISHKRTINDEMRMKYEVRETECFVILGYFLPFHLPNSPKEKRKKNGQVQDLIDRINSYFQRIAFQMNLLLTGF